MNTFILFVFSFVLLASANGFVVPGLAVGAVINGISTIQDLLQGPNKPDASVQNGKETMYIGGQYEKYREEVEMRINRIYGIHDKFDAQRDPKASFDQVLWKTLDDDIDRRADPRQNFLKMSHRINTLGYPIAINQKEILLNFATAFDKLRFIGHCLSNVERKVQSTFNVISSESKSHLGPNIILINAKMQKLREYTEEIDILFGYFMEYSNDIVAYENGTLVDFISRSLSHSDTSPIVLSLKIHNMLTSSDGVLQHFNQDEVSDYLVCTKQESPQQVLYKLYTTAVFAELKGLLTTTFARDLNLYFGRGKHSMERISELTKSSKRLQKITASVKVVLNNLSRQLSSCKSPLSKTNNAYIKLDNFISPPNNNTKAYISVADVTSAIDKKRVVTGVKFKKQYGVIYMQIQEAQLGPLASINSSTVFWVPVDRGTPSKHMLPNASFRIDVDIFTGEPGHVLTGLRFREANDGVTLETRVTPFNLITGELDVPNSIWKNNMNTTKNRVQIQLNNVTSPLFIKTSPVIESSTNEYLYFTESKNKAIAVVPFFDTTPLMTATLAPLSGIGILYKRANEHDGGFLAPVVVALNYSEFMQADIQLPKNITNSINGVPNLSRMLTSSEQRSNVVYGNYGSLFVTFSIACYIYFI